MIGIFPGLRPVYEQAGEGVTETGQVEMGRATMIVMLAAAGLLLLVARADPEKAIKGSVMKGGLTAIISILGVSWMGSSFFEGNRSCRLLRGRHLGLHGNARHPADALSGRESAGPQDRQRHCDHQL